MPLSTISIAITSQPIVGFERNWILNFEDGVDIEWQCTACMGMWG